MWGSPSHFYWKENLKTLCFPDLKIIKNYFPEFQKDDRQAGGVMTRRQYPFDSEFVGGG
jgi:hypothetical protein